MSFITPTAAGLHRPSSTLTDVLRQCVEAFGLMADATPIMIGAQYLEQNGVGSPPRVVFVPEVTTGKLGPPLEMGNAASVTHACNVHVRAVETGEDLTRYDNAYALADLVIDCVQTAATGRIAWGQWVGDAPANVDGGQGVDILFSFTYRRDVMHNAARWALPAAADNTGAAIPVPPPGTTANEPTTWTSTIAPT